ncbi:tetratricopeptide repeat protein [Solwaraspora sp. WMMD791]|uniref:fibronectin type III domain-containing protein n=1 Tax=Solwaraspora sp. WMMD791 TaxID=3016086 RepID=UPI00249CDF9B|nr:tetratricopeptide repeat protein [Solwaraspora sp. WMMD791]WFE28024.1 tetratricopeptide repeat protein [Solwaraspora sp. WMMD791]
MAQPSPLTEVRRTAGAMRDAGELRGAVDYLHRALTAGRGTFGDDDPEVLRTGHLLANLYRTQGDPSAARRVLEETLAAGERRLGETHPAILAIAFDLGLVADELGNRHEARRNMKRVASVGAAVLGADHWQVTEALRHLRQWSPEAPPAPPPEQPLSGGQAPPPGQVPPPGQAPSEPPVGLPRPGHALAPAAPGQPLALPPDPVAAPAAPNVRGTSGVPAVVAIGAAAAAVIAAVVVVMVGMTVLLDRQTSPAGTPQGSDPVDAAADPPTGVRLVDDRTAITVNWTDPTAGTVPFIVASGRSGQQLGALATVPPGTTTFTVNGLNPEADYCFAVLAVYSADEYLPSDQVCTGRQNPD